MQNNSRINDHFPASDFDDWAEYYDRSVSRGEFPFNGYQDVLARIIKLAEPQPAMPVLDLGTGTGNLALPFLRAGCDLWCTDFSMPMLIKAQTRLPGAHLLMHNLLTPLPLGPTRKFKRIISAYVFHHFELDEKVRILLGLCPHLAQGGTILIGDVAFPNSENLDSTREAAGSHWEDEFYWLADEALAALDKVGMAGSYHQVSTCGGVFLIAPYPGNPGGKPGV